MVYAVPAIKTECLASKLLWMIPRSAYNLSELMVAFCKFHNHRKAHTHFIIIVFLKSSHAEDWTWHDNTLTSKRLEVTELKKMQPRHLYINSIEFFWNKTPQDSEGDSVHELPALSNLVHCQEWHWQWLLTMMTYFPKPTWVWDAIGRM